MGRGFGPASANVEKVGPASQIPHLFRLRLLFVRCQKYFKICFAFASSREKGFCTSPLKTLPLSLPEDKGFLDSPLKMKMQTSAGIIVNTFEKVQPRVIRAIMDGEWTLISSKEGDDGRSLESLTWLDSQPRGSVSKLLLTHRPSLSIHILITNQAYDAGSTTAYISSVSATVPSIVFHFFLATTLPQTSPPPPPPRALPPSSSFASTTLTSTEPSISRNHVVHGLIIDSFCAIVVARELNIPCYCFFPSGVCVLNFFLYAPTIHDNEVLPLIL